MTPVTFADARSGLVGTHGHPFEDPADAKIVVHLDYPFRRIV